LLPPNPRRSLQPKQQGLMHLAAHVFQAAKNPVEQTHMMFLLKLALQKGESNGNSQIIT
jgi:hypothetical protein